MALGTLARDRVGCLAGPPSWMPRRGQKSVHHAKKGELVDICTDSCGRSNGEGPLYYCCNGVDLESHGDAAIVYSPQASLTRLGCFWWNEASLLITIEMSEQSVSITAGAMEGWRGDVCETFISACVRVGWRCHGWNARQARSAIRPMGHWE